MTSNPRPVVFMDINIGETPAGRLKMELFSDIVPKSVPLIHTTLVDCLLIGSERRRTSDSYVQGSTGWLSFPVVCMGIEPDDDIDSESTQDRKGIRTRHFIGILFIYDYCYKFTTFCVECRAKLLPSDDF